MSDIALRAEGLSKQYRLGIAQEKYKTLRETIMQTVTSPFRSFRSGKSPEMLWALKDVSFEIAHGEVVGIIGRNGAGKSTLLKVLSRITHPTKGAVDIYGRVGSLLEVGSGFHPELTGRENIFLNGAILGMRRAEISRKFDEIVAFAETERFIDTPVKHYSSGMYLRLAFAVAAHLDPEILVVDEVLAVGDLSFQNKCLNKMHDVSNSGRTVLFVSHNLSAIHRLSSRCLLFHQGQLIAEGPTDAVIQRYVSEGLFQQPEHVQPHDPSKPINLRRARLLDADGEVSNEVRYDRAFSVEVEYEVNTPIAECSVWVGLRTAEEVPVFDSVDTDANPGFLSAREAGYYRTIVEVPERWLNPGRFYWIIGIANLSYRISYDRIEFATFTVADVGTLGNKKRQGVLQPLLPWPTLKLN